jgi:hypothetical protein
MPVAAGDYLPGVIIRQLKKGTSDATIVKGAVLYESSNLWTICPATANQKGPFGVCARTPATTDSTVDVIRDGIVYVTAGGTIQPGQYVQNDPNTAGQVVAFVSSAISTTPTQADVQAARDDYLRVIGVYEGHENENSLNNPPTAAASTDVIRIRFGIGG